MSKVNFHNKAFLLVDNSSHGEAKAETQFHYQQNGDLVTADYAGGGIRYGKIIGRHLGDQLDMIYQCITEANELKAGKAIADITLNAEGKIQLILNWHWLDDPSQKGTSKYVEI